MDLIRWSLNLIKKNFPTLRNRKADPSCPDGTHPAGYTNDPWGKWRLMFLAQLSVEDVYLFGFPIIGFLIIGIGGFLMYRSGWRLLTVCGELLELCRGIQRVVKTLSDELSRTDQRHCASLAQIGRALASLELVRKMDTNFERLSAWIEWRLV